MSSNSIFTSANSEERWVLGVAKNFPQEHNIEIDFDSPLCVFKVPKTLTETKPEAYTPQKIGLGPYHHLRPELYKMQQHKLSAVRKFMNEENLNNIHKVVEALIQCETVLRACYDQYLDLDAKTLAWIVAIDGLYLFQFFRRYSRKNKTRDEFSAKKIAVLGNSGKISHQDNVSDDPQIENDMVMLENQIPTVLLNKILDVLEKDRIWFKDFDFFCWQHSPLQLYKNKEICYGQDHLLHYLHGLIVNDQIVNRMNNIHFNYPQQLQDSAIDVGSSALSNRMGGAGQFAGALMNVVTFYQNAPRDEIKALPFWDKIKGWIKKQDPDEQNPLVEEIKVPSVTQMSEFAGITFTPSPGGIRDTYFSDREKKFYLPVITINVHTETVLRNLVAYELSKPGLSREFTLYVDLMCGIIDTRKDVEILKNAKVIKGGLPEDEIARIFNGIRKSTEENDKAVLNIRRAIDGVNEKYDGAWRVKVKRFMKKYFGDSWKYITVVFSVVVVVLLTLQAFCSVFGCAQWFGRSTAMTGGHFLYAE